VDGLLNLDDLFEQTGLQLPEGPYETAAGWVMWKLGRLPVRGDVLSERPDSGSDETWTVEVLELDGRRAARLRVVPPEPPRPAPAPDLTPDPAATAPPAAHPTPTRNRIPDRAAP
jgi:putative hemolysin